MIAALALVAALGAPSVDVTLAPDQPVPFVYVDDPLIVQFVSDADTTVEGWIEITDEDGTTTRIESPVTRLRAQGTFWLPLDGAPRDKGLYRTRVVLDAEGTPVESDLVFCRIERPKPGPRPPLCVRIDRADRLSLLAYQGIPIRGLELNAAEPGAAESVNSARTAGYRVTLLARLQEIDDSDRVLEPLAKAIGEQVGTWTLDAGGDPEAFDLAVDTIRGGGSRAPIAVVVDSSAALEPYFANGSARHIAAAVLTGHEATRTSAEELRRVAEEAGYEGFPIHVSGLGARAEYPIARQLIEYRAAGAVHFDLVPEPIFSDGRFGPGYVELSALLRSINGSTYIGDVDLDGSAQAAVFRDGSRWTVAAWTEDESGMATLAIGDAANYVQTDHCGNQVPALALEDGELTLELTAEPQYLSGEGGDIVSLAARASAKREANAFLNDKAFQDALPAELNDLVKTVADSKTGRTDRLSFFGLLRMFPFLEQQWHDGDIPKTVAIPAMASLARLVRSLCILEQEAGEPFIELLQETLARSGEYQSQYLTSTGGTNDGHERADWLSAEVSRLMAEAKTLAEQGREIEAVGVASLAEWRARALEFAVRAEPPSTEDTAGE